MDIRISVRGLVEFLLRSGDIDNRKKSTPDAMAEGGRIHRMIQKRMGSDYEAEVSLRYTWDAGNYSIVIDGRADGVIKGDVVTIDEIKGTYRDLDRMKGPVDVHLAQAKCYAYIYGSQKEEKEMKVQMTYCHLETEEIRHFQFTYTMEELEKWFLGLLEQYRKWSDYEWEWKQIRLASLKQVQFPFPYREGQHELVSHVYRTMYHKKKLFLEAPTGVGKTISTVFPAIKAMSQGMGERIFYLTAKTITRTVADQTFQLLREQGLQFKTVILTAKEKICFAEEAECNPAHCPYAEGHYDRINDAIYDLLTHEVHFDREKVEQYAKKHSVCPFELCLDMSLFADGIICDYNYVFDPHVYLRRFFGDGVSGDYLFLIDEAHNLLERGREMYSARLVKEDFLELKRAVKVYDPKMEKQLEKCNRELLHMKRECETYRIVEFIDPFVQALERLAGTMEAYLEEHEDGPVVEAVLNFYFEVSHFLMIYERLDNHYVTYTEHTEEGNFAIKLFCVDPGKNLEECMQRARSTILFSATLLPIQYYKKLLGGREDDYEVYAKSTFSPHRRALFLGSDVTSRYSRRSDMEYYRFASYIHEIVQMRQGNYLAFFPSYRFMEDVYEVYKKYFFDEDRVECLLQDGNMNEEERENFLGRFTGNEECDLSDSIHMEIEEEEEKSLIGFCVMGGIFSEGIDLKKDQLIGAIIIGTGLPQVCTEREILKNYFDEDGESGFDYAYRYPGMNKVLQSAGRVIRTADDVGIIALLDDRFCQFSYQKMFPREWEHFEVVTKDTIAGRVERFWEEWY